MYTTGQPTCSYTDDAIHEAMTVADVDSSGEAEGEQGGRKVHIDELDNVLAVVEVGSTMWSMERPDSDRDYFCLWSVQPRRLLNGTYSEAQRNHRTKMVRHDFPGGDKPEMEATEVAHQVHMLLDSNINSVQRALSSVKHVWTNEADELGRLVQRYRAKNVYHSVAGMNSHNLKRYWARLEIDGPEFGVKKSGQILRVVDCAIRVLDGKPYTFEKCVDPTFEKCTEALTTLKRAYENSSLPERPDEEPYREFLYNLRIDQLDLFDPAAFITGTRLI